MGGRSAPCARALVTFPVSWSKKTELGGEQSTSRAASQRGVRKNVFSPPLTRLVGGGRTDNCAARIRIVNRRCIRLLGRDALRVSGS